MTKKGERSHRSSSGGCRPESTGILGPASVPLRASTLHRGPLGVHSLTHPRAGRDVGELPSTPSYNRCPSDYRNAGRRISNYLGEHKPPRLGCAGVPRGATLCVDYCPGSLGPKGGRGRHWFLTETNRSLTPLPSPGLHLHKSQHHKIHPDTRPWKQTDKRVVGTLERWGRPAPVSAEGGGTVPAPPTGLAF